MKPFTTLAVGLLTLVAIAHAARLFCAIEVTVAGQIVPLWLSAAGAILAAVLAAMVWRENRR